MKFGSALLNFVSRGISWNTSGSNDHKGMERSTKLFLKNDHL